MVRSGLGVLLSVLVIPGAGCRSAPAATPAATPPPATATAVAAEAPPAPEPVPPHQSFTLDSKILGETRRINVYTPPGQDAAEGARHPVLYMPDGGLKEDFPHVTRTVEAAVRAGEMRPVIVVGIENTERRRDMTGPTQVEEDRKIAPRVGGSSSFRAFLRDELMPVIEGRVRGDGQTAIIGESLAGLFVLETFFEEPGLFNTYIALSPSLWWNDRALARAAAGRLKAQARSDVTLYFATTGDDGMAEVGKELAEALRVNARPGLRWHYEPRPDLLHSTIYRAASPGVLRKLFPPATRAAGELPRSSSPKDEPGTPNGRDPADLRGFGGCQETPGSPGETVGPRMAQPRRPGGGVGEGGPLPRRVALLATLAEQMTGAAAAGDMEAARLAYEMIGRWFGAH